MSRSETAAEGPRLAHRHEASDYFRKSGVEIPIEFVREIGAPAVELVVQAGEDTDIGASRSVVSPTFQET